MNLFNYLMAKKGHNTSVRDDLFAYLLGKRTPKEVKTATGTTISISDVTDTKIVSLTLSKESTQETTTGKNLFDSRKTATTSNGVTFTPNDDGSITIKGTSTASLNVTLVNTSNPPVLPAGTYRKSIKVVGTITKNNNYCFLTGRDNNNNNVLGDTDVNSNMTTSNKATLEEEHRMTSIGIWTNAGNIIFDCTVYIQIEEGETATEWEKYTGGQPSPSPEFPQEVKTVTGNVGITITNGTSTRNYTIPLNDNEIAGIGDYKDELIVDKNGKCWLNKKTGKVVLSGNENWELGANGFFLRPDTNEDFANRNKTVYLGFCNNFIFNKNSTTWTNKNYCGFSSTNIFWVRDDFEIATTIVDWNNWLSTHNTDVYYALATPEPIDLNYTVDLTLFEGVNNISNSEDMDMTLKYY